MVGVNLVKQTVYSKRFMCAVITMCAVFYCFTALNAGKVRI